MRYADGAGAGQRSFDPHEREAGVDDRSAVAGLARFALRSRDVEATLRLGVDVAVRLLELPVGVVVRGVGERWRLVHGVGPLPVPPGEEFDPDPDLRKACAGGEPLVIEDRRTDPRFPPAVDPAQFPLVAGLSVPVQVDGREWGRLLVAGTAPRRFSATDVDVVWSVADIVASALERHAVEQGNAAVAAFGRFALEGRDVAGTVERALDLVVDLLAAPMGSVIQLVGHDPLRFRAVAVRGLPGLAVGQELHGPPELAAFDRTGEPLIVGDWAAEERFAQLPASRASRVRASLSVSLLVSGRPWGRLQVFQPSPTRFSDVEVGFVQAVAHALSAALERDRTQRSYAAAAAFGRFALRSPGIDATLARAVDVVCEMLEAPMASVVRLSDHPLRRVLLHARGTPSVGPGGEFAVTPELDALNRAHDTLVVNDWSDQPQAGQLSGGPWSGVRASVAVRVPVAGREWGRLAAAFGEPRRFSATEIDLMQSVGHLLAAAVERDRTEQTNAAVAAFGRFALRSRDRDATVRRAVEVVSAVLEAPMAAVLRVPDHAGRFEVLHGQGALSPLTGLLREAPAELDAWLRQGGSVAVEDWATHPLAPAVPYLIERGARASVSAPLLVCGRTFGRLTAHYPQPRQFDAGELDVVEAVAHLLSSALERDATETRLRETAQALQHALLPARLPRIAGIETAVRYLPAHGDRVGGDWYDVLELAQGGVGLVIGDVEGHDSTAAAVMGQVRTMVRTHAGEGHTPAEVMGRVNQFVGRHTERLVTCWYGELRPDELTVTGVSAGHPPPSVLTPDGVLRPLRLAPGPLLGLDDASSYTEQTSMLPPGGTLLMITDGMVDDLPGAVHRSWAAFAAAAGPAAGLPVERLADALARRDGRAEQRDDAALLVVRLGDPPGPDVRGSGGRAHRLLRSGPESVPAARRFVRDILTGWDLTGLEDAATLAVSELVTNAVVHTSSAIRLSLRRTGPDRVWIGVHDDSDRFPGPRRAADDDISGRGLAIVEMVADSWGVEPGTCGSGKTVWAELSGG